MAHHRPDLLQLLIDALDDKRNDLIIHIDRKSNMDDKQFHCNNAKLVFIERMDVNWGGYSQIACEYALMKESLKIGHHAYYHLLTGVNYPLKNQDDIYDFFKKNNGKEFIGFDNSRDYSFRVKYYVPFSEHGKLQGLTGKMIQLSRFIVKLSQNIIKKDNLLNTNYSIKKGCAYFSITEELLQLVLSKEEEISSLMKHTTCCDEVFIHTIAYNSDFKDNIYSLDNEYDGCQRELAWPSNIGEDREGRNFCMKDLDYLLNSNRLFAMKFESKDGIELINKIKEIRNI